MADFASEVAALHSSLFHRSAGAPNSRKREKGAVQIAIAASALGSLYRSWIGVALA